MTETALADNYHYTWDDYCTWPDDMRWEIIGGKAYAMSPSPLIRHQWVQQKLSCLLGNYFVDKKCNVFPAPTDVKLTENDIVQPDLLVVCDKNKIKRTHIEGAPTLVIEILSPSSVTYDRVHKMQLYARNKVKEVWLITPYPWLAEVYVLDGNGYRLSNSYEKTDILKSNIFPDMEIKLEQIFDFQIDKEEQISIIKEGKPPYDITV